MTQLVSRENSIASFQLVRNVYKVVAQYPTSNGAWGQPPFPSFDELVDEFMIQLIADSTGSREKIEKELEEINAREEMDLENGFRDSPLAVNLRMELMNTLLALQCTFTLEGEIYNSPLQEVW